MLSVLSVMVREANVRFVQIVAELK